MMSVQIKKPANWSKSRLEDLMSIEAGQAYVLSQFDRHFQPVEPDHVFKRSGRGDYCAYEIYEDGSLWYVNNAEDEVWSDAGDFANELNFSGLDWDEDGENPVIDEMDRNLLIHLHGEEGAREFFERAGGNI